MPGNVMAVCDMIASCETAYDTEVAHDHCLRVITIDQVQDNTKKLINYSFYVNSHFSKRID